MRKNINGALYNQSVTIVEPAGEEITDCRNKFLKRVPPLLMLLYISSSSLSFLT